MAWRPAHASHAIERVSITLQFVEATSIRAWQEILNAATLRIPRDGFNSAIDEADFDFGQLAAATAAFRQGIAQPAALGPFPGMINSPGLPPQIAGGRTFQKIDGTTLIEQVSLRRGQFIYMTSKYSTWTNLKQRAGHLLSDSLGAALKHNLLQIIKLEYWDRFSHDGEMTTRSHADLFKQASPYLPSFVFDQAELFHVHVGFFAPSHVSRKRLINLNVDMIDLAEPPRPDAPPAAAPPRRSAGMYVLVQDTHSADQPLSDWAAATLLLDEMHTTSKRLFADVIVDSMAQQISLRAAG
jgi:uncharacterized protein (TIGR04255 family)